MDIKLTREELHDQRMDKLREAYRIAKQVTDEILADGDYYTHECTRLTENMRYNLFDLHSYTFDYFTEWLNATDEQSEAN